MNSRFALVTIAGFLCVSSSLVAHHGTGISYEMDKPWTTKAVVTQFRYANPHPQLYFDRTTEKGTVEHWSSELYNNPSMLVRNGWPKGRSEEALKPGTVVTLTLHSAKAGGNSAVITRIQNERGEDVVAAGRVGAPRGGGGN